MAVIDSLFQIPSRMLRFGIALTALLAVLVSTPALAQTSEGSTVPGRYIVTVEDTADPRGVANAENDDPRHVFRHAINGFSAQLDSQDVQELRDNPDVEAIEPVKVIKGAATQTSAPYNLDRTDQRYLPLNGNYVYYSTGAGVRAYVIDSGVQTNHAQFGNRALSMADYVNGTHADCHGHGTHVAGTIAGSTYGVAKQAMIRSVRVLNCANSGTTEGLIQGVNWVRANAAKPAVANISIGAPFSSAVNKAVLDLSNSGVFVAVSAGNENTPACNRSPSSSAGAFTVASSSSTDTRAWDSNYGSCVDSYAPGVNVLSARLGGGAQYMSGTSMASPSVTGVVALGKATHGDSYTSAAWGDWLKTNSTVNVIKSNPAGTPNRLLYNPF